MICHQNLTRFGTSCEIWDSNLMSEAIFGRGISWCLKYMEEKMSSLDKISPYIARCFKHKPGDYTKSQCFGNHSEVFFM